MTGSKVWIAIVIMSLVTIALRAVPFIIFKGKKTPPAIEYLGQALPYAVIGMIVVYCLKGLDFTRASGFVPGLIASVIVVLSYLWKRNTLLSIITGTVIYMVLIQFVFV